jgi:hypothetical protein
MRRPRPTKIPGVLNWDYQIEKKNLKKPFVEKWILERQLNYGGFKKIKLKTLLKYWPDLKIDRGRKIMIENFLKTDYAKELIKKI